MIRRDIQDIISKAIKDLQKDKLWTDFEVPEISVTRPEDSRYGDYATNIALQVAKVMKKNPMETAGLLASSIQRLGSSLLNKVETAPPGFINFFLSKEYLQKQVGEILKKKAKFGQLDIGKKQKVNIEFISANPTGPLHVGNARGGFCGDVLANVLSVAGHKVTREYYVNDMGNQITVLQNSLEGKEPSYKNPYIDELKQRGERDAQKAVRFIAGKIKASTLRMGIKYDKWFYESDLYRTKEVDKILSYLKKNYLVYQKDGALWFSSTKFGDDKDRVLIKADGEKTYILSDIAYLRNKFKRGFDELIIFLGAEHHGYVGRLKAGAAALGYRKDAVRPIIMQLVHLIEGGKEVKMSKRTGIYVTIDELLDEVGLDVSRFFFLMRGYGNHLNFDLDLAKEQSEKNPVYYVQYAHARICSILRKCKMQNAKCKITVQNSKLLVHPSELILIKQLIRLPEIIENIAKDYQVQRLPQYAVDLAAAFHQFYRDCKVLGEDKQLTEARLALLFATKIVLKRALDIMGISAPEKM